MRTYLRRRPSPALVVACVALVVALGGTSYAAFNVPKNSVGTKQLKNGAVTTSKIKAGAVSASDLNTSGLTVPSALHANSADSANHAGSADSATSATNATTANSATSAQTANVANELGTVSYVTATFSVSANSTNPFAATATCPASTTVIGTGIHLASNSEVTESVYPVTGAGSGVPNEVDAFATNNGGSTVSGNVVIAICAPAQSVSNPGGL